MYEALPLSLFIDSSSAAAAIAGFDGPALRGCVLCFAVSGFKRYSCSGAILVNLPLASLTTYFFVSGSYRFAVARGSKVEDRGSEWGRMGKDENGIPSNSTTELEIVPNFRIHMWCVSARHLFVLCFWMHPESRIACRALPVRGGHRECPSAFAPPDQES